jgi:phosphopantothenoylcysteine decarboxylase/phosphopantothenate--cysteine ligase
MNGNSMPTKQCRRLLLGVTASIHCVGLPEYIKRFREDFADSVQVLMSETAAEMFPPQVLSLYADQPVQTQWWAADGSAPHIRLPRECDLFVVVPTTANSLCKIATGIADTLVTAAVAASPQPVLLAPAMNAEVWRSAPVRRAVDQIRADGHYVIDPEPGFSVTENAQGAGMGTTPDLVLSHMRHVLSKRQALGYFAEATSTPVRTPSNLVALKIGATTDA